MHPVLVLEKTRALFCQASGAQELDQVSWELERV
jgi:hypothetical protein